MVKKYFARSRRGHHVVSPNPLDLTTKKSRDLHDCLACPFISSEEEWVNNVGKGSHQLPVRVIVTSIGLYNIVRNRVIVEQRWLYLARKNDLKEWPRFLCAYAYAYALTESIYTSPKMEHPFLEVILWRLSVTILANKLHVLTTIVNNSYLWIYRVNLT